MFVLLFIRILRQQGTQGLDYPNSTGPIQRCSMCLAAHGSQAQSKLLGESRMFLLRSVAMWLTFGKTS